MKKRFAKFPSSFGKLDLRQLCIVARNHGMEISAAAGGVAGAGFMTASPWFRGSCARAHGNMQQSTFDLYHQHHTGHRLRRATAAAV